ncbi:MAG: hypothetical protein P1Q69_01950 [Candidatus Thorarchaeota archaeon]|nr:hypothetical protein [Candidatus Thorarchaeota archaeon]
MTPEDILAMMQESLVLVRLEPVANPLNQLMTGHDLNKAIARSEVTLEDVAEFIVRPVDLLDSYIDLIDTFLEVSALP